MPIDIKSPGLANIIAIVVLVLAIVFFCLPSAPSGFVLMLVASLAVAVLLK